MWWRPLRWACLVCNDRPQQLPIVAVLSGPALVSYLSTQWRKWVNVP